MNPLAMTKTPLFRAFTLRTFAGALLLAATAACGGPAATPPLQGAAIGGEFDLVDTAGNPVKWKDFDGKYRMVYFGYAYCPDVCPFDVQRMIKGYTLFAKDHPELAAEVQPIFVTVDPERDTPKVVGEFTRAFSDKLVGLTGTPENVAAAAKTFAIYTKKGEVNEEGGYLMDHSRSAYLMGRQGEPIALLPVEMADGGEAVAAELAKWVR